MTDINTQTVSSKTPLPTYAYRKIEGGKSFRTRVGVAWMHKNGKGCNIDLDAVPLNGRLVVFFEPQTND